MPAMPFLHKLGRGLTDVHRQRDPMTRPANRRIRPRRSARPVFVESICLVIGSALAGTCAAAQTSPSEVVVITPGEGTWEITVPVGHATLVVPRGKFEVIKRDGNGAVASPRYFFLEDKTVGEEILAGWLESASGIKDVSRTLQSSWHTEFNALKKAGMAPYSAESGTVGDWATITFEIANPAGSSVHIRASRIVADTWIDLHLSVTRSAAAAESKAEVTRLLESLAFRQR